MAVKLLKYFLIFFVLIMVFLLTKNPYSLKYNSAGEKQPDIEIYGVKSYDITPKGVSSFILADRVERYKNFDKLYNIKALHMGISGLIDTLKANQGLYAKNTLYLDKNVKYARSDNLALNTNSLRYDLKDKILSSNNPFVLIRENVTTHGSAFTYDMQKGIIRADKIKTVIKVDK